MCQNIETSALLSFNLLKSYSVATQFSVFGKRGRMEYRYQRVCLRAIERHSQGIYQVSKIGTGDKHLAGFQKKKIIYGYLWSVHIVNGVYGDQIMCSISYMSLNSDQLHWRAVLMQQQPGELPWVSLPTVLPQRDHGTTSFRLDLVPLILNLGLSCANFDQLNAAFWNIWA